ncbi:MAG: NAD(P)-binding domain-containing protein [Kiritimatiellae bacterium]|nr:NAD(P)-binding domain-containing protein [Kiritimatiellia bacterium]
MKKVLIPTKLDKIAAEILRRHGNYTVVQDDSIASDEALLAFAKSHPDAYAMIVRSEKVTPAVMDAIPALKVIVRAGAGVNTIDTRYARRKGIDVMNTPGANANAVAEEVIAMVLADMRHIVKADASCRAGQWEKKAFMGRELSGKTVGIVGLGAIGRLLARRLSGFECRLLGHDPFVSPDLASEYGVTLVDLPELFAESDVISLHVPENEKTRGMVNRELLSRMKPGAILVNCARAGIVVEEDLRAVKAERQIRFLNDVYPKDAEGPKSVADIADLMLPHLGASTREANANAARRAAEQLIEFDEKGITSYIVNRDIPEGLDRAYADLAFRLTRFCRALAGSERPLKMIETSFYGALKPFANYLLVPIVAALDETFDRSMDPSAALKVLQNRGIEYTDRVTDDSKGYRNSITIDLTVDHGGGVMRRTSVRGTVAEGALMVSRVDDYHKLYIEPAGHLVAFSYRDRPGVLGQIGAMLAGAGINIDDVRNPHDSKGEMSLAILRVNQPVAADVVERIARQITADIACSVTL